MNQQPRMQDFAQASTPGASDGPLAIEAEEALIGAMFINNDVVFMARSIVQPDFFAAPIRAKMFEAALAMVDAGKGVSPITIKPFIDPFGDFDGMTPLAYAACLMANSTGVFHAKEHAEAIRDAWSRRRMVDAAYGLIERACDSSPLVTPEEIASQTASELADLLNTCASSRKSRQYGDVLLAAVKAVEDRIASPDSGIDWFLPELNDVVGSVRPGNLIGFMSDSGGGKTSLSLAQCRYAAEKGIPSAFLSIEVTEQEAALQMAAQRLRVSMSEIDQMDLLKGKMDALVTEMEQGAKLPLVIEPFDRCDLKAIGATIATLKKRMGLRFVMIDHAKMIDLPGAKGDMFAEKVNALYRGLKAIAKSTVVAIVILIQRNSDWKGRDNPRPIPSDAYGGGAVMQNLDAFFSIYRPAPLYVNKLETEHREKERVRFLKVIEDSKGFAWVVNHKRRRGQPLGVRRLRFEAEFTAFSSVDNAHDLPPELF